MTGKAPRLDRVGAAEHRVSAQDIADTYDLIGSHLRRTPLLEVGLDELDPACSPRSVVLKLEQLQVAGSFKVRGAFANLMLRDLPEAGVVAASGGNHGVAVAYAAQRLGVRASVFVPTVSAPEKIARIRALGAELVVGGERYADALAAAEAHQSASGALGVHAFDQRETVLGQGTLAVELDRQLPAVDTVLVPVGGGGLIAGIAAWYGDAVRVVGVEPDEAPTLTRARAAGRPTDAPAGSVASDALAPRRVGELVFPITQRFVDDVVLVDDAAIIHAQAALWRAARVVAEPAAAVGVAALLGGAYTPSPHERVAVVISGANTAPAALEVTTAGSRNEPHA
ncbi:serine/threonine dehydratase [Pseudonocardia sp. MH-G8]|uniref:serine/threonine dehydratase n=1 Tax=Pseudonocardia sp. MH-G8 TaxID=1854588 RepID=UPI000B9FCC92|nr:serine/threonine dehydratase [Pseudonocardia sp. MH-G8]OZM77500.1 threonine dehydratase [Pseudonocardia sp. MH-G8]